MLFYTRSPSPRWVRSTAALLTFSLTWTFALATPAQLLAQQAIAPHPKLSSLPFARKPAKALPPAKSLRQNLKPLTSEQAKRLRARPQASYNRPVRLTLLDSVGHLSSSVSDASVSQWQARLHSAHLPAWEAARLHLQFGEVRMARDEAPEEAYWHFQQAQTLATQFARTLTSLPSRKVKAMASATQQRTPPILNLTQKAQMSCTLQTIRGTAAYDAALALFAQGRYAQAATAFKGLLTNKTVGSGFDRRDASMMFRHTAACAGYHDERRNAGITEPTRLDPLCGAEALAACLRGQGRPYDRKTVLAACRVTGRGSNLQDILTASAKLGMVAHTVSATEEGLKNLPKPLVAYVEHDHFVALTQADKAGVTYLCSDCGVWPGGRRFVTWKQWRKMEATVYAAITKPNSPEERKVQALIDPTPELLSLDLKHYKSFVDCMPQYNYGGPSPLNTRGPGWEGGVTPVGVTASGTYCGYSITAPPCQCSTSCPYASGGGGGEGGGAGGKKRGPAGKGAVNLATGQYEREGSVDLSVYNPTGPSVSWSRSYHSLRGKDAAYQYDDLGAGWTHEYNVGVFDPTPYLNIQLPAGQSNSVTSSGSNAPASGVNWQIVQNGTVIADSSNPNGWTVTFDGFQNTFHITPPASANGQNYSLRYRLSPADGSFYQYYMYYSGGNGTPPTYSVIFDVLPPAAVLQGGTNTFAATGTDTPANGETWDILYNGSVIAAASHPAGWIFGGISYSNGTSTIIAKISAPFAATVGTGYEVRTTPTQYNVNSTAFQVVASRLYPAAGLRYIFEPNGARVGVSAASVPTAANPHVACTVQPGNPMLVSWDYDAASPFGHYTITNADRSTWTTGTFTSPQTGPWTLNLPDNVTAFRFQIAQLTDNNGNTIHFNYGSGATTPYSTGFPLLSSITDQNGQALVTFQRAQDGTGNLTSVSDRYGRSVYYHVSTYATQNVPAGFPQSQQELDHVSQVVTTGTANPPDQEAFGYQNVTNEGTELVPMMHTVTVPSPTGAGQTTATINYSNLASVANLVDANGNSTEFWTAGGNHSQVKVKDPQGNLVTSYTAGYDMNMSETSRTNGATDGNGANTTPTEVKTFADPNDPYRPSAIQDGNQAAGVTNGEASYTWDQYGNCLTSTSARGITKTFTYNYANFALGELTQVQEGAKTPTTLTYYEPSGLIHTITAPAPGTNGGGTVTSGFTYDALGNVLTETSPGNNATPTITNTFNYTNDGFYSQNAAIRQPLTKTDNLGHVTHMRYDARANLTAVIDALGNETDLTYNIANENVSILFAATGSSGNGRASFVNTFLYPGGPKQAESQYNESGVQVFNIAYTLGAEGEELARSGSTQPYSATYDSLYRTIAVADGNNHATQMFYNAAGYAWKTVYPNGDTIQYTSFDKLGNPTQRVDGRGIVTNYVFNDVESKLTDVQYPASPGLNVHIGYDGYGRAASITDGSGSHAFGFDDRDEKTSDTTTYSGLPAKTLTTTFNPDGSRASLILPDGTSFSYQYDAAARATGLTNPSGQTWSWSYLDNNWLAQQNANNQIVTTPTRNQRGFVTELANQRHDMMGTLLSDYQVGYAPNLTLGSLTANIPNAPAAFSGTTQYAHDAKLQLTTETSNRAGGYSNVNAYDGAGNPTTFKGAVNTYNNANQNTAWVHDGNGNPTLYKGQTLTFDAENRMTSYGSLMTAGYRADGMRAWKQNASGRTYYLYDGDQLIEELDASGNKTAVNTWGHNVLLARTTAIRTLLYSLDALGQLSQQVDAVTGTIAATYVFDAWGTRAVSSTDPSATSDPYSGYNGAAGYYSDWETGLQLLGHRYLDVATGRFLNRDPIGMVGGVNVYEYCRNSPVMGTDSTGLSAAAAGGFGTGGVVGAVMGCAMVMVQGAADVSSGSVCALGAFCEVLLTCALGAFLSVCTAAAAWWSGCIIGAVMGAASYIIQQWCNLLFCNIKDNETLECKFSKLFENLVLGAIAGCVGGYLGSLKDFQPIGAVISGALGLGLTNGIPAGWAGGCNPNSWHGLSDWIDKIVPDSWF